MIGRLLPLAVLVGCLSPLSGQTSGGSLKVLFLGNSLTDSNDVPVLVQAMAARQGVTVETTTFAPGGYAIEDHWIDQRQRLLRDRDFDVVVLQQGPSTLPESQAHLRQWAVTWADEARRHGTEPALFMIWPQRTQANGFALVSQSYRNAALAAAAAIFPAGEAWQEVLRTDPTVPLYSGDNFHAAPAGSFLAAMVIARGLVALDPERVPVTIDGITVSSGVLARFRTVVAAIPAHSFLDRNAGTTPDSPSPTTPSSPPPGPASPSPSSSGTGNSRGGGGSTSAAFSIALLLLLGCRQRPA